MCGDYNLRREKRYVEVDVRFTPDGKIRPLAINYDKTRTYGIDRVLAVKHGTSAALLQGYPPAILPTRAFRFSPDRQCAHGT